MAGDAAQTLAGRDPVALLDASGTCRDGRNGTLRAIEAGYRHARRRLGENERADRTRLGLN